MVIIASRGAPKVLLKGDDKVELNMEEFKKWLKEFDEDGDGKISAKELREAIRANGGRFCRWKANRLLKSVDTNLNGFIDDNEIWKLVVFAQKQFGKRVVAY